MIIDSDAAITIGIGGSTGPDCKLYRAGTPYFGVTGGLFVDTNNGGYRLYFGGGGEGGSSIRRVGAGMLQCDGTFIMNTLGLLNTTARSIGSYTGAMFPIVNGVGAIIGWVPLYN
jgi:hypothetical protein